MQTFLPVRNFKTSAKLLDYRRLGKQRVEGKQLLNALSPEYTMKGWKNHPATVMWRGYENALKEYVNVMIDEWVARGYNNTMEQYKIDGPIVYPEWLGNERIHKSHRMNLLRKDFVFYSKFWTEEAIAHVNEIEEYPYYWPVGDRWKVSTPDRTGTRWEEEL